MNNKYNLYKYVNGKNIIDRIISILNEDDINTDMEIEIINSIADFIQNNLQYDYLDSFNKLADIVVNIIENFNDEIIDYFPASLEDLAKCEPIYEEFDGWDESVANARSYEELHPNARKYLERIEELTDTRISIVSVGPRRDQTMRVKPL